MIRFGLCLAMICALVFSASWTAAADTTSGQTYGTMTSTDTSGDDADDAGACGSGTSDSSVSTDTATTDTATTDTEGAGDDESSESADDESSETGAACGLAIKKTGDAVSTVGATENFTYQVTNTGKIPVAVDPATGVTDDKCSPVVYDSGDTANPGFVDPGETWQFHCAYVVSQDAENPQTHDIVNTATVKGTVTIPASGCEGAGESEGSESDAASTDSVSTTTTASEDGSGDDESSESGCSAESGADESADDDGSSTPKTVPVSATATWTTHIVHPALSVTKTATEAAGVNEGDTIHYTITVTNVGDTIMNVTAADVGCTGLTPVGFSLSPAGDFPLAPTESKKLTCTHVAGASDGSAYVNEACATGVATPAAGPGGTVKKCGSVSVPVTHPTPPGSPPPGGPTPGGPSSPSTPGGGTNDPGSQLLLPTRIAAGTARLLGPSGCAATAFNARVRGTKIARVVFVLDGKTVARLTKPNLGQLYSVRINPAKLRLGVHRLVATVTFQRGSGTKAKTLRLAFQRCGRNLALPRFTG